MDITLSLGSKCTRTYRLVINYNYQVGVKLSQRFLNCVLVLSPSHELWLVTLRAIFADFLSVGAKPQHGE
jgi:hypothetical protein